MSQENVEIVRRLRASLFCRSTPGGEDSSSALIADVWDPNGDYYPVRKFPESRPRHGPDEVQRFMAEYGLRGRVPVRRQGRAARRR